MSGPRGRIAPADLGLWRFLLGTLASVCITEVITIILKFNTPHIEHPWEDIADILILSAFLTPVLYYFLYTPMIRAKREADELAEWNRDVLEMILDRIPYPVFYKDSRGSYRGCNRAFEEFAGKNRAEIMGHSTAEVLKRQLAAACDRMEKEAVLNRAARQFQASVGLGDGTVREVLFNISAFLGPDGKPDGSVGVVMDITRENTVQREMEELKGMLRLAAAGGDIVLFSAGKDGAIDTMSVDIANGAREKSLFELFGNDNGFAEAFKNAAEGRECSVAARYGEKENTVLLSPRRDQYGEVSGVLGAVLNGGLPAPEGEGKAKRPPASGG